jgi:hypothetical protein
MRKAMRFGLLVLATPAALSAQAPATGLRHDVVFQAPVGHRQPTVQDIDRAGAARAAAPVPNSSSNDAFEYQRDLGRKLQICRCS